MFSAVFAMTTYADIGVLVLVLWAACELSAVVFALDRVLKAPEGYRFSALRASYLWRSLTFSDGWKAYNKVANVPVKSSALYLGTGIFLGLGEYGYGTMLEVLGLSALCAMSFTGITHLTLLLCTQKYPAAVKHAKKIQDRIEFSA